MDSKDYILTQHVRDRMIQRGISENEIDMVLNDPEISYPGKQGEMKLEKTIRPGRKIRVVCRKEGNKTKIITVIIC